MMNLIIKSWKYFNCLLITVFEQFLTIPMNLPASRKSNVGGKNEGGCLGITVVPM